MSFSNGTLHGFAMFGTLVLTTGLFGGTLYFTKTAEAAHVPPLREMMTIEASLARKSVKKTQPQKELKAPEPPAKPEGVSRDENKAPVEPKKDEPKKPPPKDDKPVDLSKFKHPTDEDAQPGAANTQPGQFDGSEKGFAPINAGDPYWRNLAADIHQAWEIPSISKVNGDAVGCIHLEADGKIVEVKLDRPSGDDTLDDSVQRAMKSTQKARNNNPQPVPTTQLGVIKGWVCLRFNPNS